MKKKRLDFNYKPLTMLKSMVVANNIPQHQLYDPQTGEYTPDYALEGLGLAIQPHITAVCSDGTRQSGEVTASDDLTNIVWTEIIGSTSTVITASTPGYTIVTTGANKCRLVMSKNLTVGRSVTLRFECDYLDTRTGDIHHVECEMALTVAVCEGVPVLSIDHPGTTIWNPFGDVTEVSEGVKQRVVIEEYVFNASLKYGGDEAPVARREFKWEKKRPDGTWTEIGTGEYEYLDLGWSITNNGATFTQSTDCIGDKTEMRVRVRYGDLSTVTFGNSSPTEYFTIVRRLPDYDYDYLGVPDNLEPDVDKIYPEAIVTDRYGNVENFDKELMPKWYTGANTATGVAEMELVATGRRPEISTSKIGTHGMKLGLDMERRNVDLGNYKVVTQDGAVVIQVIDGVECVVISK